MARDDSSDRGRGVLRTAGRAFRVVPLIALTVFVVGATLGTGIAPVDDTAEDIAEELGLDDLVEDVESAVSDLGGPDADSDRLADDAENRSKAGSADLPQADRQHKDMYVVIVYSEDAPELTEAEKESLREIWAGMNVSNPDNETGVDLHIVEERRADQRLTLSSETNSTERTELMAEWYSRYMSEGCGVYHLVILGNVESETASGWGDSPGYAAFVDSHEQDTYGGSYSFRVRAITHELLHNVVGDIEGEHAPGDAGHSKTGWLSHVENGEELSENQHLSAPVARQLSDRGFRDSTYYEAEVC